MSFYRRYSMVIGLFLLAGIIVILLSSPGVLFSEGVSFIDTEISLSSGVKTYVQTNIDFGDNEHVKAFPHEFEGWQGYDHDTSKSVDMLGSDVMLLRSYYKSGNYQPVFFMISQAKTESNFHAPPVCYQAQGYNIEEEGKEDFTVSSAGWAADKSLSPVSISIPVKKLVVSKENERRIVLYFFIEGNQFTSDTITMVRVSSIAPVEGSYDGVLQLEKEFIAQAFPYMFELDEQSDNQNILSQLTGAGLPGYAAITFIFAIPLAIIIYPQISRKKES